MGLVLAEKIHSEDQGQSSDHNRSGAATAALAEISSAKYAAELDKAAKRFVRKCQGCKSSYRNFKRVALHPK